MKAELARNILLDYVFGNMNINVIKEKYVSKEEQDELTRKLLAESLVSDAIQEGYIALGKQMNLEQTEQKTDNESDIDISDDYEER